MTRFVIQKSDIVHNYNEMVRVTGVKVIPTLKADCYGLGADAVFELLKEECGVSLFAVSKLEEALPLCNRDAEILLLSCYSDSNSVKTAVDADITVAVGSFEQAKLISEYAKSCGKKAKIHLKVDTGFGRFGFFPSDIDCMESACKLDGIEVCGIFSHFSNAFGKKNDTNDRQLELFCGAVGKLISRGIDVGIRHIANSCGALRGEKYRLDAVRTGSALLGRLPMAANIDLRRVGSFETTVADIRLLKKGSNIGYGNVFKLKKDTKVAVLCAGSSDGVLIKKDYDTFRFTDILRYGFSVFKMLFKDNRLTVKINGKICKSVGRVALTHTMVDVSGIPCECGDKAVIDISPLYVMSTVEREYI